MKLQLDLPDLVNEAATPLANSIGNTLQAIWSLTFGRIDYFAKKLSIQQAQNLEKFKETLEDKTQAIPEENLVEPNLSIIGPAIESSKFYFNEKELRDMFANLIASSMDKSKETNIHPSFPQIIQNLSVKDAEFLKFIYDNKYEFIPYCILRKQKRKSENLTSFFSEVSEGITLSPYIIDFSYPNDPFYDFSSTIENLLRLQILSKNNNLYLLDTAHYSDLLVNPFYVSNCQNNKDDSEEVTLVRRYLEITSFGRNFMKTCI